MPLRPIAHCLLFASAAAGPPALAGGDEPAADAPAGAAFVSPFEPPTLLTADGAPINTGPEWGHSAPAVTDLDGDGLADLVVGSFGGHFAAYRNAGTAAEPRYESAGPIRAGGEPAEVRIYCCIGSQARFADFDGDGRIDMLANSYDPGHCYLFRGTDRDPIDGFAAREEVKDAAGVPVRSNPDQRQDYESFGSFFAPVDYDADGDLDLLIGCFDGTLKVRMNEGTPTESRFAAENLDIEIDGEPIKVEAHLCPAVADWDGDGRWDVVAGSDDGGVVWFRNAGSPEVPAFEPARRLVPASPDNGYNRPTWGEQPPAPGIRSQVAVTDHDGDGDLDLLVGDFYTEFPFRGDLSAEQRATAEAALANAEAAATPLRHAIDALDADFKTRYPDEEAISDEANAVRREEFKALTDGPLWKVHQATELEAAAAIQPFLRPDPNQDLLGTLDAASEGHARQETLFDLAEARGHVWLYLRK